MYISPRITKEVVTHLRESGRDMGGDGEGDIE